MNRPVDTVTAPRRPTSIAAGYERRLMVTSASDYTAGILLTGAWEPKRGA